MMQVDCIDQCEELRLHIYDYVTTGGAATVRLQLQCDHTASKTPQVLLAENLTYKESTWN